MWVQYGVVLVASIIGAVTAWRVIRRERRPSDSEDALMRWTEKPLSAWDQDRTIASFITFHASSVVVLGILFLLEMNAHQGNHTLFFVDATPFMPSAERAEFNTNLDTIATSGLGITWFLCSSLLSFPFARHLVRPMYFMVLPTGIVSGPYLFDWSHFSHYSADPRTRLIRLYASRTPELAHIACRPPNADLYTRASGLLAQHLSATPPRPTTPWYRRRTIRAAILLLITTIPFVLIGFLIYALGFTWGWLYYSFVTPLVVLLGLVVFRQL